MATDALAEAIAGPERPGGQGLDDNQEESGNRAIYLLLTDPEVGPQTDFLATFREGAYEVWAQRGMVRFQRSRGDDGRYHYQVLETIGENPIERQDERAVATIEEELQAARASGNPTDDANLAYIEPEQLTYPFAYERISQLFDSPNAPDIVLNPKSYAYGRQPGQHGALDVVQARAPLIFSGPGVRAGTTDAAARHIDIAPTVAKLMGFPTIAGTDAVGQPSEEVYLRRQDGRPLDEIMDGDGERPERVYILHLDGMSNSELHRQLATNGDAIPNLRRIIEAGHTFRYGSMVNFPSITWPSHNTIGTGCWAGHHDVVNPTYYLRETREVVTPQGQQFDTAKFVGDEVETLYEAFHRVLGSWQGERGALTAAIHEPCTRGADHSVLERRVIGDRDELRFQTREGMADNDPRWSEEGMEKVRDVSVLDTRGVAQVVVLFTEDGHPPPAFTFHEISLTDRVGHDFGPHHEAVATCLEETDRRLGRVVAALEEQGLFDSTLFVVTADHGMAATRTELAASQVDLLPREGMKAVVPSPLIYLLDMDVEVQHSGDGRTATITVLANDPDASGERPPAAGAAITVSDQHGKVLARATADAYGVAGVPLPVELTADEVLITLHHDDYNPRHLRLDGSNVVMDLRELLYQQAE